MRSSANRFPDIGSFALGVAFDILRKPSLSEQDYCFFKDLLDGVVVKTDVVHPTEEQKAYLRKLKEYERYTYYRKQCVEFSQSLLENSSVFPLFQMRDPECFEIEVEELGLGLDADQTLRLGQAKKIMSAFAVSLRNGTDELASLSLSHHSLEKIQAYFVEFKQALLREGKAAKSDTLPQELAKKLGEWFLGFLQVIAEGVREDSFGSFSGYLKAQIADLKKKERACNEREAEAGEKLAFDVTHRALEAAAAVSSPLRKGLHRLQSAVTDDSSDDTRFSKNLSFNSTDNSVGPSCSRSSTSAMSASAVFLKGPMPTENHTGEPLSPKVQAVADAELAFPINVNGQELGETLLHLAAYRRDDRLARMLLDKNADLFVFDAQRTTPPGIDEERNTPLDIHDGWLVEKLPSDRAFLDEWKKTLEDETEQLNKLLRQKARLDAVEAAFKGILEHLGKQLDDREGQAEQVRAKLDIIYQQMDQLVKEDAPLPKRIKEAKQALKDNHVVSGKRTFCGLFTPISLQHLDRVRAKAVKADVYIPEAHQDDPRILAQQIAHVRQERKEIEPTLHRKFLVDELFLGVVAYIEEQKRGYRYSHDPDFLILEQKLTQIKATKKNIVAGAGADSFLHELSQSKLMGERRGFVADFYRFFALKPLGQSKTQECLESASYELSKDKFASLHSQ